MNQTDIEYWEQRSAQRMWEHMNDAEKTAEEIAKSYKNASRYLNKQIDEVFVRFKNKHDLSTAEAKRLLNMMHDSTSIQSLKLALQQSKDSDEKAELLKMLESPAYSARIKRFEEMQEQLDVIMNNVYQTEKSLSTKHYVDLASDSYYRSIFDIQKGTGLGFQFAHVSQDEIDKLLHSNWSGINYTHRIWGNTNRLAKTLKEEMLVSLMTGRSNLATAEVFREKFNVGAYEARRLVRTESAYIVNEMEQQAYEECDIEKYMFVATLDKRTSEICQKKDHKVYAVKERSQGVNCPPMHPFCRSTTIAYLDDETISSMERLATDDETGEKNKILANTSYEQWIKSVNGDTIKVEEEFVKLYSGEEANRFFYYDDYENNHGLIAKKNEKYGKWRSGLSEDAIEALYSYTADGYSDVNEYLRKVSGWEYIDAEMIEEQISMIDDAIESFELKSSIVVQRGANQSSLDVLFENYDIEELTDLVGKNYYDDAFMSSTVLYGNPVATTKPVVFDISIPAGKGRGAYINEFGSQFQDVEYEFLIKRGANFTITDISEDVDLDKIYVKMVMDDE